MLFAVYIVDTRSSYGVGISINNQLPQHFISIPLFHCFYSDLRQEELCIIPPLLTVQDWQFEITSENYGTQKQTECQLSIRIVLWCMWSWNVEWPVPKCIHWTWMGAITWLEMRVYFFIYIVAILMWTNRSRLQRPIFFTHCMISRHFCWSFPRDLIYVIEHMQLVLCMFLQTISIETPACLFFGRNMIGLQWWQPTLTAGSLQ